VKTKPVLFDATSSTFKDRACLSLCFALDHAEWCTGAWAFGYSHKPCSFGDHARCQGLGLVYGAGIGLCRGASKPTLGLQAFGSRVESSAMMLAAVVHKGRQGPAVASGTFPANAPEGHGECARHGQASSRKPLQGEQCPASMACGSGTNPCNQLPER
jgi:hypothetical protein